jgi:hypothetical protein
VSSLKTFETSRQEISLTEERVMTSDTHYSSVGVDMIKGAAAGGAAMWAMERAVSYMWTHESQSARRRYDQVTEGKYVPDRAAEQVEHAAGLHLTKDRRQQLAMGLHWGIGIGAGVSYALLRRVMSKAAAAQGLFVGALFWALFDEGATVLFGLAKPPQDYPRQAHARGLVGHLVYGFVAETAPKVITEKSGFRAEFVGEVPKK